MDIFNSFKVRELISRGNHNEIMELISKYDRVHRMPAVADRAFVERGNHEEIMSYIDRAQFWSSGVKALFKRNVDSEIFAYLKWNLTRVEERLLLERGDTVEIKRYLFKHMFKGENVRLLVARNVPREIEMVCDKMSLGPDAEECMLDICSTEPVMYYLERHPLFCDKQERKLLMRGNSREINYYKGKYGVDFS